MDPTRHDQWISEPKCSVLNNTVYSKHQHEVLCLHSSKTQQQFHGNISLINNSINNYYQRTCLNESLLTTPVFIDIVLLPCPPGFNLTDYPHHCDCYPILSANSFKCSFINKTGYITWNSTMWVNAIFTGNESSGIIYNQFCPLDYCMSGKKTLNIAEEPDAQCDFNHAGRLCGGCRENYSLAIGSSRCIPCPNDNSLALLVFFAAAGVVLVLIILSLNLTVTQGLINGLIFYANIIQSYKSILYPVETPSYGIFFQTFIAWMNLDFGIESCFSVSLSTFWKTWLQFLFPFYIWAIAGVIIIACRYSSRLTNLIGNRAVPLLATLFLLSYMKLLCNIIAALAFAILVSYPEDSKLAVWYLDGNLPYCQHRHIYLFVAAIAALIFLWLPFTILLLLMQCLRRISHLRLLRWINKFTPVYNAYFEGQAPLLVWSVAACSRNASCYFHPNICNMHPLQFLFSLLS